MDTSNKNVVYRTINLYARERYIWFFADAPHLLKPPETVGIIQLIGNLEWNFGKDILWSHISRITYDESNKGLKLITKITDEHVRLTAYSKMNVSLATQVLSKRVSNILYGCYPPETHGTAELYMYMDNVRNQYEGIRK